MSAWMKVTENVKGGGLIYECERGHVFHQTKEALDTYINAKGTDEEIAALDRPAQCAQCTQDDAELEAALKGGEEK